MPTKQEYLDKLLPLAAVLVNHIDHGRKSKADETYQKMLTYYQKAEQDKDLLLVDCKDDDASIDLIKRKVYELVVETLFNLFFYNWDGHASIRASFSKAAEGIMRTEHRKVWGVYDAAMVEKNVQSVQLLINQLKRCVQEFSRSDFPYFFIEPAKPFPKVEDFLNRGSGSGSLVEMVLSKYLSEMKQNAVKNAERYEKIARLLCSQGASLDEVVKKGFKFDPVCNEMTVKSLPFFLELGADVTKLDKNYLSQLISDLSTLDDDKVKGIKLLLQKGVEYRCIDEKGNSLLHRIAAYHQSGDDSEERMVQYTVKIYFGDYQIRDLLDFVLEFSPDLLHQPNKDFQIPLVSAIATGSADTVKKLIQAHKKYNVPINTMLQSYVWDIIVSKLLEPLRIPAYDVGVEISRIKNIFLLLCQEWSMPELSSAQIAQIEYKLLTQIGSWYSVFLERSTLQSEFMTLIGKQGVSYEEYINQLQRQQEFKLGHQKPDSHIPNLILVYQAFIQNVKLIRRAQLANAFEQIQHEIKSNNSLSVILDYWIDSKPQSIAALINAPDGFGSPLVNGNSAPALGQEAKKEESLDDSPKQSM